MGIPPAVGRKGMLKPSPPGAAPGSAVPGPCGLAAGDWPGGVNPPVTPFPGRPEPGCGPVSTRGCRGVPLDGEKRGIRAAAAACAAALPVWRVGRAPPVPPAGGADSDGLGP